MLFKNLGHNEYRTFIHDSMRVAKIASLISKEYSLNHINIFILGLFHNTGHFINRKPEDSIFYKVEMNGLIKT
jgi:HD superfamily phosphodiesterase